MLDGLTTMLTSIMKRSSTMLLECLSDSLIANGQKKPSVGGTGISFFFDMSIFIVLFSSSQVCLVRSKKNMKKRQPLSDDSNDELGDPVARIQAQIAAAERGNDELEDDEASGQEGVGKQQDSRQPNPEGSVTESDFSSEHEDENGWSDFGKGVGAYKVPEPMINVSTS